MTSSLVLMFLLRVVLSVSTNTAQKQLLLRRAGINATWTISYALMLFPACVLVAITGVSFSGHFFRDVLIGGVLDALGNLAMLAALRTTDLSVFGPLNALRPAVALLFGWVFLAEAPSLVGGLGVLVTMAGTALLLKSDMPRISTVSGLRWFSTLGFRLLGICLSAFGAVFLKRAAVGGTVAMTLAGWVICGLACLVCFSALRTKSTGPAHLSRTFHIHHNWLWGHALMFFVMQWFTIRIFQQTLLAYSFVFFQFAILLQLLIGRMVFKEKAFQRRRIAACMIMGLGSSAIIWKG